MILSTRTGRYVVVGVVVNGVFFLLYLALTDWGILPQVATTLVFGCGVLVGYVLNKNWAFASRRADAKAFPRYVSTYACGYLMQFSSVTLFVILNWPHELGQVLGMALAALTIYALLSYWVFPKTLADQL
jgi:putative flippase GtrA